MAAESGDRVVLDAHPKALRSKEARVVSNSCLAFFSDRMRARDPLADVIRDPVTDFRDGVMLFRLLEALTGESAGPYSDSAASDRGRLANLVAFCTKLNALGVRPLGDGYWTSSGIVAGNALECWSMMVALAVHFGCDRELPRGSFLPVVEQHFRGSEAAPWSQKTRKFILIPE